MALMFVGNRCFFAARTIRRSFNNGYEQRVYNASIYDWKFPLGKNELQLRDLELVALIHLSGQAVADHGIEGAHPDKGFQGLLAAAFSNNFFPAAKRASGLSQNGDSGPRQI